MYIHIFMIHIYIYIYTHVDTYYVYTDIYYRDESDWNYLAIQGVPSGKKKDLLELDGGEPCLEFTYGKSFYNWNILELSRASFSNSQELLVTIN